MGNMVFIFPCFLRKRKQRETIDFFRRFPLLDISEKYTGISSILPATRAADRGGNVVKCSNHVTATEAEDRPRGEPGGGQCVQSIYSHPISSAMRFPLNVYEEILLSKNSGGDRREIGSM